MLLLSSRSLNLTKNIVSCRTHWPARFGVASFDRMNFLTCDRDVLLPQARYTPAVTSVSVGRRVDLSQQRRANFLAARDAPLRCSTLFDFVDDHLSQGLCDLFG
jgi:hypothetical protein